MSGPAALAAAAPDGRPGSQMLDDWLGWLGERIDPRWRAGEWDQDRLLFTGDPANPATALAICPVPNCGVFANNLHSSGYCRSCHEAFAASALGKEAFDASYVRPDRRMGACRQDKGCEVPGCPRKFRAQGLCGTHYDSWRKTQKLGTERSGSRA